MHCMCPMNQPPWASPADHACGGEMFPRGSIHAPSFTVRNWKCEKGHYGMNLYSHGFGYTFFWGDDVKAEDIDTWINTTVFPQLRAWSDRLIDDRAGLLVVPLLPDIPPGLSVYADLPHNTSVRLNGRQNVPRLEDPILVRNREYFQRVFRAVDCDDVEQVESQYTKGSPPWYRFKVNGTQFTAGWRKRVVSVQADLQKPLPMDVSEQFEAERVTFLPTDTHVEVHAWSEDDTVRYIKMIADTQGAEIQEKS